MRVLVTGAAGFIGQHVVNELMAVGHDVLRCDRRTQCPADDDIVLGDITNPKHMNECIGMVDGVIHLAGKLGTQELVGNPVDAVETNIVGGLNILEACANFGVPACFIGVGNHWMQNTYSITKTTVERFVAMYNNERGTRVNIVRAMNAYGPGQVPPAPYGKAPYRKVCPTFVCNALHNQPLEIYGDGEQVSDMVYVEDVAMSLVHGLHLAESGRIVPPIEVGPVEHTTVNEFARLVIKMTESKSGIKYVPMRPGEEPNARVVANVYSMLKAGIDPDSFMSLRKGMEITIDHYRENYGP